MAAVSRAVVAADALRDGFELGGDAGNVIHGEPAAGTGHGDRGQERQADQRYGDTANAAFLLACLNDPAFQAGEVTTGLIADRGDALTEIEPASENEWQVAAMQLFAPYFAASEERGAGPWEANFGFRLNREEATRIMLHVHRRGVGVCGVFTYEIAETKVTQVMDLARQNQHPLQCTIEKE